MSGYLVNNRREKNQTQVVKSFCLGGFYLDCFSIMLAAASISPCNISILLTLYIIFKESLRHPCSNIKPVLCRQQRFLSDCAKFGLIWQSPSTKGLEVLLATKFVIFYYWLLIFFATKFLSAMVNSSCLILNLANSINIY